MRAIIAQGYAVDYCPNHCYHDHVKSKERDKKFRLGRGLRSYLRLFSPGIGIKRWLFLVLAGITLLGIGLAMFLLELYRTESTNPVLLTILATAALAFLPRPVRVVIFGGIGVGMVGYGLWRLNRSLLMPFLQPGASLVEKLTEYHRRERGPRVVAIGGGHGLSTLLRGLKAHTHNLTAVVTVADDGGSSGELRRSMGILPPGDIRNCLAALSNDEALLAQLFQYRFSGSPGLDGHSFGNLFISALSEITGSFEAAVAESGRVLSVHGRVLPSTLHNVRLVADVNLPNVANEIRIEGESKIPIAAGRVRRVWLEPTDAAAFPPVLQAILSAEMIVVGPGSLYTSILPNLLVRDVLAAIKASRAIKVFVCNLTTQIGETTAYNCYDHVRALEDHLGDRVFDVVVCNDTYEGKLPESARWVEVDERILSDGRLYSADLADDVQPLHHDSIRLAQVLMDLYLERTGPLS